jgi:hypothetical protein
MMYDVLCIYFYIVLLLVRCEHCGQRFGSLERCAEAEARSPTLIIALAHMAPGMLGALTLGL